MIDVYTKYRQDLSTVKDYLFFFLAFWTMTLLFLHWAEFFTGKEVPKFFAMSYMMLLSTYIIHKEVGRWTNLKVTMRPGEIFVYIWWISLFLMLIIQFFTQERFELPKEMTSISYEVILAFIIADVSKAIHAWKTA